MIREAGVKDQMQKTGDDILGFRHPLSAAFTKGPFSLELKGIEPSASRVRFMREVFFVR